MPLAYTTGDALPPEDIAAVDEGLHAFNLAEGFVGEVQRLYVVAKDAGGRVVGGAVGRTWGRCCELQQLWVDGGSRHSGIGTGLMARFEAEAAGRGCKLAYLDTFSFQAPAFYRRLGYAPIHTIAGFGHGIEKYLMQKELA